MATEEAVAAEGGVEVAVGAVVAEVGDGDGKAKRP